MRPQPMMAFLIFLPVMVGNIFHSSGIIERKTIILSVRGGKVSVIETADSHGLDNLTGYLTGAIVHGTGHGDEDALRCPQDALPFRCAEHVPAAFDKLAPASVGHHDRATFTRVIVFLLQAVGIADDKVGRTGQGHGFQIVHRGAGTQTLQQGSEAESLCPFAGRGCRGSRAVSSSFLCTAIRPSRYAAQVASGVKRGCMHRNRS